MAPRRRYTFGKGERLVGKSLIDRLFRGGGSRSMSAFPLRAVYMPCERKDGEASVKVLVSVPKRCFKHAVDRNRIKRQVREAYRLHKATLCEAVDERQGLQLAIAFIWLDGHHRDSREVHQRVANLLQRISERI